jgi:hypothetical protein
MYRINVKPHLYIFLVACNDRQNNCKLTDLLENDLASLDKKKLFQSEPSLSRYGYRIQPETRHRNGQKWQNSIVVPKN